MMAKGTRSNGGRSERRGGSRALDIDRLLEGRPAAQQSAEWAQVAARAGELVRRKREERGLSQGALATRIGSSQAHLSELERGLGAHGPTVTTLTRIMHELGDDLLLDTKVERERRETELMATARSSVRDVTMRMSADLQSRGAVLFARYLSDALKQAEGNPFAEMLTEGMMAGFYMVLRLLPGQSRNEIMSALRSIEKHAAKGGEALPAQLLGHFGRRG